MLQEWTSKEMTLRNSNIRIPSQREKWSLKLGQNLKLGSWYEIDKLRIAARLIPGLGL